MNEIYLTKDKNMRKFNFDLNMIFSDKNQVITKFIFYYIQCFPYLYIY